MQISRRDALMGASAAVAVATVPTAVAARAALAGDPVIELAAQFKAAYRTYVKAADDYENVAHDAGYSVCDDDATVVGTTIHGERYSWGREQILQAAGADEHLRASITPEERDRALAAIDTEQRIATRTRCDLGLDPLKTHAEQSQNHWRDLEAQMLDMPALSVAGILAKIQCWYCDAEIASIRAGDDPDYMPGDYTASIYRDLERLAGEAPS